jgi:hypothetical protein
MNIALQWIIRNPAAHPTNVKAVAEAAYDS